MTQNDLTNLVKNQKQFFLTGTTLPFAYRKEKLQLLSKKIKAYETNITEALRLDLGKAAFESYETEIGIVLLELKDILKNLKYWMKRTTAKTPIIHFPSSSYIIKEPYGISLIIAPWNYPFQLAIAPLIGAIAAGNCAIIKPSEYAPHTAKVISQLIAETFDKNYISVVEGDADVATYLLAEPFDYIFFTGSTNVGRIVMQAAAKNLTPVTLELGGKSPCIVDESADIALAATRIVWGKFVNAGQTCVAPDYVLVHETVKNQLVENMKKQIEAFYGQDVLNNPDYPKIINKKHFKRLQSLMQSGQIVMGGNVDKQTLKIAPTLIEDLTWNDPIMQEEIFGPLMPILTYKSLPEVIAQLKPLPKPLALYLFTTNKQKENDILTHLSFGGGCINDTLIHFSNAHLPFGGVGASGLGAYHGKTSFDTFSHAKSIMKKSNLLDLTLRYPPFKDHLKILKFFMR